MFSLDSLRPNIEWEKTRLSPSGNTMGEILDRGKFRLCYDKVFAERERHFALLDKDGNTELYVVFADIDEFAKNVDERVDFAFQIYQDRLIGILWTKTDARDPLGFPFIFRLHEERERYQAIRLLEQEEIPVHYLAQNEDRALIHVFSETVAVPLPEKKAAAERLLKSYFAKEGIEAAGEAIGTKKASALSEGDLLAQGTAYYLDLTALLLRYGEEEAKEKTMDLLSQALLVVKRHPRSAVREARLIVWAGEKPRERETDSGEKRETRGDDGSGKRFLLGIYVTPEVTNWFSPRKRGEEEEDPFTRYLRFLPEYLCSAAASPLREGAYPLMEYDEGTLYALELDRVFQEKARSLFASAFAGLPNPYETD